jgi:primosomal protein N' (replication factor Y) (superfamily II helicase)
MSKYVIQIAPLIPLPFLRTQIFSYWHGENIPIGSLVSAPFYFREIQGIVVKSSQVQSNQRTMKLKNIRSVIEAGFLSEVQIELAVKISEYYLCPLGSVLKLMVPKIVKTKDRKDSQKDISPKRRKTGVVAKKILKSSEKKFLLMGRANEREELNIELIREYAGKKQQCLVLVPEIFFARGLFGRVEKEFSEDVALIHSRITKGQYFSWWKKIQSGDTKIIIASKMGIFLRFADLGLIIVQDEQDASFKQWKSMPRYGAVLGAEFLADLCDAKLVLESSVPSARTFQRTKNKEIKLIQPEESKKDNPNIEIFSVEKEKGNSDFPISRKLYSRLAEAINSRKQSVLFVNRRGFSTRTICENCKRVLKCPKCAISLVYSEEAEQYRCLHCSFRMNLFSSCPSCGGFQFSHRGVGTQTVEKKLKSFFPSARVARLDADSAASSVKSKNVLEKFSAGEIDVLVGTQSIIKGIYSNNIGLAAAISGRDFVDGIEPDSRNQVISRFFHMENMVSNGNVLVQAFFGANPLFEFFDSRNIVKYLSKELAVREKFKYPPFSKLIKLSFREKSESLVRSGTKKIFDLLRATSNDKIEIIGPYEPAFEKKKTMYKRNILIRIDVAVDIRDSALRSVLGGLGKGWTVDVDPVSLFQ